MENLELPSLVIFLISLTLELVLANIWNRFYFTKGIPIFILHTPVEYPLRNLPSTQRLDKRLMSSWVQDLAFKEFSTNVIGFQEKVEQIKFMRYPPVMHGLLMLNQNKKEIVVKGYLNWGVLGCYLFVSAIIAANPLPSRVLGATAIVLVFSALLYLVQANRYRKVARFAAEEWSRHYFKAMVDSGSYS